MQSTIVLTLGITGLLFLNVFGLQILMHLESDQCKRAGIFGFVVSGPAGVIFGPAIYDQCKEKQK